MFDWSKGQEIRSGKFTAWDHNFEMPAKNLEADKTIMDSVTVGTVTHKLKVANNDSLELYDYPGGYASRFDGINKSGGEQAANLQHIFDGQHAHRGNPHAGGGSLQPAHPRQGRARRLSPRATPST